MADEVRAAAAAVEAEVAAEGAGQLAGEAVQAAVVAEQAAVVAVAEAQTVKEMADREVAHATLDAEQRMAAFEQEIARWPEQFGKLTALLEEMKLHQQSIQSELSQMAWLKELEMEVKAEAAKGEPSAGSSGTAGDTKASDGGATSPAESAKGAPDKKPEKPDEAASEKPSTPAKESAAKRDQEAGGKHRWL